MHPFPQSYCTLSNWENKAKEKEKKTGDVGNRSGMQQGGEGNSPVDGKGWVHRDTCSLSIEGPQCNSRERRVSALATVPGAIVLSFNLKTECPVNLVHILVCACLFSPCADRVAALLALLWVSGRSSGHSEVFCFGCYWELEGRWCDPGEHAVAHCPGPIPAGHPLLGS